MHSCCPHYPVLASLMQRAYGFLRCDFYLLYCSVLAGSKLLDDYTGDSRDEARVEDARDDHLGGRVFDQTG
jgi:hypothetical protein